MPCVLGPLPAPSIISIERLEWLDLKQTIDGQGRIGRKRNPHVMASPAKNDSSSKAERRQRSVMFSEKHTLKCSLRSSLATSQKQDLPCWSFLSLMLTLE